jgi:hypothetical protein
MVVRSLILGLFAAAASVAHAQGSRTEIYKCVDASGRASYTNDRRDTAGRKCELVTTQINVAPAPPPAPKPQARPGFPRESSADRANAKDRQREILEKELAAEQADLARAREALLEQESVREGDERNYARVLERLQPYRDRVETHEKNVQALRRELLNLDR